jgi:hypothetical protein
LGILPTDAYLLTVAEANLYLKHRNIHEVEVSVSLAWRVINFLGAFLGEKMEDLDKYLPETPRRKAKTEKKKASLEERLAALGEK